MTRWPVAVICAALGVTLVACDEAEQAGARASAEVFRVSLKAQDTKDETGGVRNIEALREAADDLPGDPNVIGIRDGDGDGVDDDGFVAVRVDDQFACITLPESGEDIDVSRGRCR
jgi:hypothetical protein